MMEAQRDFGSVILLIIHPLEFLSVADLIKKCIQLLELDDLGTFSPTLGIPKI